MQRHSSKLHLDFGGELDSDGVDGSGEKNHRSGDEFDRQLRRRTLGEHGLDHVTGRGMRSSGWNRRIT